MLWKSTAVLFDSKAAMAKCKFNNLLNNNGKMSDSDYAKSQKCMGTLGFHDVSGFDICKVSREKNLEGCS